MHNQNQTWKERKKEKPQEILLKGMNKLRKQDNAKSYIPHYGRNFVAESGEGGRFMDFQPGEAKITVSRRFCPVSPQACNM